MPNGAEDAKKLPDHPLVCLYNLEASLKEAEQRVELVERERDHLKRVNNILSMELGAVIHEARTLMTVLLNTILPRYKRSWPELAQEQWRDLEETIDSAAKCLK